MLIVLNPKRIQGHAIRRGENFGVNDIGANHRHGAGDPGKKSGVIGRKQGHFGHCLETVNPRTEGKRRVFGSSLTNQTGMTRPGLRVRRQPVTFKLTAGVILKLVVTPVAQFASQIVFDRRDPFGSGLSTMSAEELLGRTVVEFAQQLPFPAVPDPRPHSPNVSDR